MRKWLLYSFSSCGTILSTIFICVPFVRPVDLSGVLRQLQRWHSSACKIFLFFICSQSLCIKNVSILGIRNPISIQRFSIKKLLVITRPPKSDTWLGHLKFHVPAFCAKILQFLKVAWSMRKLRTILLLNLLYILWFYELNHHNNFFIVYWYD